MDAFLVPRPTDSDADAASDATEPTDSDATEHAAERDEDSDATDRDEDGDATENAEMALPQSTHVETFLP